MRSAYCHVVLMNKIELFFPNTINVSTYIHIFTRHEPDRLQLLQNWRSVQYSGIKIEKVFAHSMKNLSLQLFNSSNRLIKDLIKQNRTTIQWIFYFTNLEYFLFKNLFTSSNKWKGKSTLVVENCPNHWKIFFLQQSRRLKSLLRVKLKFAARFLPTILLNPRNPNILSSNCNVR